MLPSTWSSRMWKATNQTFLTIPIVRICGLLSIRFSCCASAQWWLRSALAWLKSSSLLFLALLFALYGRVAFLCLSKEKSPKERIPNMLALRVPCDTRMSRRDMKLASAQTVTSRNPRLILCFSAGLNGRVKVKIKDEWLKTKDKRSINSRHSAMSLAGIHSFKDSGYRPSPVWRLCSRDACTFVTGATWYVLT